MNYTIDSKVLKSKFSPYSPMPESLNPGQANFLIQEAMVSKSEVHEALSDEGIQLPEGATASVGLLMLHAHAYKRKGAYNGTKAGPLLHRILRLIEAGKVEEFEPPVAHALDVQPGPDHDATAPVENSDAVHGLPEYETVNPASLVIDPALLALVPRPTAAQREALMESIKAHGQDDPIKVRRADKKVFDGFTRHAITTELCTSIDVRWYDIPAEEDLRERTLEAALARRNMSKWQLIMTAPGLLSIEKERAATRRALANAKSKDTAKVPEDFGEANEIVARKLKMGRKLLERGLFLLEHADEDLKQQLQDDEITISGAYFAMKPEKAPKKNVTDALVQPVTGSGEPATAGGSDPSIESVEADLAAISDPEPAASQASRAVPVLQTSPATNEVRDQKSVSSTDFKTFLDAAKNFGTKTLSALADAPAETRKYATWLKVIRGTCEDMLKRIDAMTAAGTSTTGMSAGEAGQNAQAQGQGQVPPQVESDIEWSDIEG